ARQGTLRGLHAALESAGKWVNADESPERAATRVRTMPVVVPSTDVETSQDVTFAAFTDPVVFSRWLGVPVTLEDGRFACTMEWGTSTRGRYEIVSPPELIALRWDFEDDNIPVPGGELTAYLRIRPAAGGGAHVEGHQLVDTPPQAEFMQGAWAVALGRLAAGVARASDPAAAMDPRPRRPKRHGPSLGQLRPRPRRRTPGGRRPRRRPGHPGSARSTG